jgi:predicted metal-dependent hydrolase
MSPKGTPADVVVAGRDVRFDVSAVKNGHWLGGDPVGTAVFNALSLTFPEGERLFIEAVRHYRPQVSGKLLEDVRGFIAQESIHAREHHTLNQLIDRGRYPVAGIEAEVKALAYQARSRGPMVMLTSTIALEHFTAMLAEVRSALPETFFDGTDPEIERLWTWHAMEETEHKAVAFDVFMLVTKGWSPLTRYFSRVASMAILTLQFTAKIEQFAVRLLMADGYSPRSAKVAARRFLWGRPGIFRIGWRAYISWYRPGFHPWDNDNRELLAAWKNEFESASSPGLKLTTA